MQESGLQSGLLKSGTHLPKTSLTTEIETKHVVTHPFGRAPPPKYQKVPAVLSTTDTDNKICYAIVPRMILIRIFVVVEVHGQGCKYRDEDSARQKHIANLSGSHIAMHQTAYGSDRETNWIDTHKFL